MRAAAVVSNGSRTPSRGERVERASAECEVATHEPREVSAEVITAAVAGQDAAFTAIVREYDERLRVLAYALLRDRDAMDDALQDVYLKAYRSLPDFRDESALGSWLYRITYTTGLSRLRAANRVEQVSLDEDGNEAPSPADLAEMVAARGDLANALSKLPVELRACVLLVYREGLTYREAADILGVAPGTIGWRLSAARRALRAALQVHQGGDE